MVRKELSGEGLHASKEWMIKKIPGKLVIPLAGRKMANYEARCSQVEPHGSALADRDATL